MMNILTCGEDQKRPARSRSGSQNVMQHYIYVQFTAVCSVGNPPLISSVVTLIMCRIIALALYDIYQEK